MKTAAKPAKKKPKKTTAELQETSEDGMDADLYRYTPKR